MFLPLRSLAAALLLLGITPCANAAVPETVGFNEHIRPILSNTCFYCHGPDEKHREAHLRLDVREEALAEHDGVRAIIPGKPEESDLMLRLLSHDQDEMMPPPKSKKPPLTSEEVETIRRWIAQGAKYEGHWAFQPLAQTPPPAVAETAWVKNPIDQFILARLAGAGLVHAPEADRATLLRRVALDLTGLLPTPEEVDAFQQDASPGAYERQVERLLASPHYGERWGRHWLDQARYADSNGYSIDSERAMWPYRDWVIQALNEDMPFDRFTIEQLAGDLLPGATKAQRIATAFHRNTLINEEGGVKPEQFRIESVLDRVNTTGAVWLGLTVGCAQCHSHKFDPISHREYYQLFAFFNQGEDVNNKGATVEVARGEVFGTGPTAEERRRQQEASAAGAQPAWEKTELARLEALAPTAAADPAEWKPAQYLEYDTAGNGGFQLLLDNSLLADGKGPFNDTYRIVARAPLATVAAVRVRVLTDDSLPNHGPGFAKNGNFVLTDFTASVGGEELAIASAVADHAQPDYPAEAAIDTNPKSGWAINVAKGSSVKMNAPHEIVFTLAMPLAVGDQPLEFKLHHDLNEKYLIGRLALEFSATAPPMAAASPLSLALRLPAARRTPEQVQAVREAFEKANPGLATTRPPKKAAPRDPSGDVVELMVMKDVATSRPTFLFQRGDFLRPDEKLGPLQPGVLAAVQATMPAAPEFRTRLDLARWLVAPTNPLTPRVTVNRIWMRYFGHGLVETDDDFGSQGAQPTHPALLDWLASELVRGGWSMKALHRLIVTSATYRQASTITPEALEKDPRNVLLGRQARVRLEAEIVRDAALCASGLLEPALGGPSVRPPQPEGVYSFTQNAKKWTTETGPNRYRRGLYTMFYRSAPHPLFTTFDAPDFQQVCTRRARSNTPLQALTLANDTAFFEMAQALAARAQHEAPGSEPEAQVARIRRAFALAICREPTTRERGVLTGYYEQQKDAFQQSPSAAVAMLPQGAAATPTAAALVGIARVILNSDAFITRE